MTYYRCQHCKKVFTRRDFKDEHTAINGEYGECIDIFCPLCGLQIGAIFDWAEHCNNVEVIQTNDEQAAKNERAEREREFEQGIWKGVR